MARIHEKTLHMKLIRRNGTVKVLGRNEIVRLLLEKSQQDESPSAPRLAALPKTRLGGELETKNA